MLLAGIAVGADTGVIYIRGEYPNSIRLMEKAITYLNDHNLIQGFKFKIIKYC